MRDLFRGKIKKGLKGLIKGKGYELKGTLQGAADVDFFKFHGKDARLCVTNAFAKINTPGVRLCMLAVCDEGLAQLKSCGKGAYKGSAMMGMGSGCCRDTVGDIKMDFDCKGTRNESATMYLRLSQKENRCIQYDVEYHF